MNSKIDSFIKKEKTMSNLKAARQAIQAELNHARQGAAYYQERVAALEEALAKIDSVDLAESAMQSPKAVKPNNAGSKKVKGKRATEGDLPPTGGDFWLRLITNQPQSAREILEAAVKAIGILPSKEQLKKLSQRQTNALHNMVKAKMVSDAGSGRARRFFRAQ
jgi:hypothetical protein